MKKVKDVFGDDIYLNDISRIEKNEPWKNWGSMPEVVIGTKQNYKSFAFEFESEDDIEYFKELTGLPINESSKFINLPLRPRVDRISKAYVHDNSKCDISEVLPKYPIFLPSKGRWDHRFTSNALIEQGIKHYMVVEKSQYEEYKRCVDPNWVTLLILPQEYLDNYDTCDDLGFQKSKGPGAARNFAWDYAIELGAKYHWVMDDNLNTFYRYNYDNRHYCKSPAMWRAMEDHTERYSNMYMSGPQYRGFVVPGQVTKPFTTNTRVYSCNLIKNDIPFRWRGRYNEDTDLSLNILKAGFCTAQYYAFIVGKLKTQAVPGGNTAEFYAKEGTMPKSKMLVDMHPDVAKVCWKFSRWHHEVDYTPFKNNKLILNPGYENIADEVNNYGMHYIDINTGEEISHEDE